MCCCWKGKEDDHETKWEVLRNIWLDSYHNGIGNSQDAHSTLDEFYYIMLKIAGVSKGPANCTQSVEWCFLVYQDLEMWPTAEISCGYIIKKTFFDRQDFWWYLPQPIAGMLHTTDSSNQVMLYGEHYPTQGSDGQNANLCCSNWWNIPTLT